MEMSCFKLPEGTQMVRYIFAKRKVSAWQYFLFLIGNFKLPKKEYVRVYDRPELFAQIQADPFTRKHESIFLLKHKFYISDKTPYRYFKANIVFSEVGFPIITKTVKLETE